MITPEPTDAADAVLAWSRAEQADIEAGRDDYRGADWRAGAIDSHIQLRNAVVAGKIAGFRKPPDASGPLSDDEKVRLWHAAWDAYHKAYNEFRDQNPGWRAFYTIHHGDALDAALRAYDEARGMPLDAPEAVGKLQAENEWLRRSLATEAKWRHERGRALMNRGRAIEEALDALDDDRSDVARLLLSAALSGGVSGTPEDPAASRDQATIGVRALIDAYASEDPADGDYGPGFRRDRVAGEAFDALRAVAGLHDEMDRRIGRALLKAARPTPPPPRAER